MNSDENVYTLSVDPVAMERVFMTADILSAIYDKHSTEYGMLGLATMSNRLQIVATPLLHNQFVTSASVYQSAQDFFPLDREVNLLSRQRGELLIPTAFFHRHPSSCSCSMSSTDEEFLMGTFLDQVSAVSTFTFRQRLSRRELNCSCIIKHPVSKPMMIEFGLCFSVIVTADRTYRVYAARKLWCPWCQQSTVSPVQASLRIRPRRDLTLIERRKLWKKLEVEIEAKLNFGLHPLEALGGQY